MYDNDLVERVAAAIFEAHNNDLVCWLDAKNWEREEYGELALAAIEAMDVWSAMIAALEKDKANVG